MRFVTMALRIVFFSLLISSASAVVDPCAPAPHGTVAPPVAGAFDPCAPAPPVAKAAPAPKKGLTLPEEVGIGLGAAAGVAALGAGIAEGVKPKEAAAKRGPRINAKEPPA